MKLTNKQVWPVVAIVAAVLLLKNRSAVPSVPPPVPPPVNGHIPAKPTITNLRVSL